MKEVIFICAGGCFDISYKVSDTCDDEGDTAQRYLPPVYMSTTDVWCVTDVLVNPRITQA